MHLIPENASYGHLTIGCSPENYSASIISRAVEDANAHLYHLNVTADTTDSEVVIDLRFSHKDAGAVARSLYRHGYRVISGADDSDGNSDADSNPYAALIRYLEI